MINWYTGIPLLSYFKDIEKFLKDLGEKNKFPERVHWCVKEIAFLKYLKEYGRGYRSYTNDRKKEREEERKIREGKKEGKKEKKEEKKRKEAGKILRWNLGKW